MINILSVLTHMRKQKSDSEVAMATENSLYALSAETLDKTHDNYPCVDRIVEQIKQPDIYNIAITGPYGSGKTSVLKTLIKEHSEYKYLNITLAKFDSQDNDPLVPKKRKGDIVNTKNDEEKLNWLLEYSIMQQLIYHEEYSTIPQSRFKRIKNLSKPFIYKSAAYVLLFLICLAVLFEPNFLKTISLYQILQVGNTFKIIIDAVCAVVLIVLLFLFITKLISVFGNSRLNKINLKDGEIGFCDDDTNSILNKHLDEILYFFEVTKYNVVIIEDLDRFETPIIFAKLREINTLINYYKPIFHDPNRKIVFIYAVKDDTFTDNTLRTKFFDVILPVIPIINPSNAGSKLKQLLSSKTSDGEEIPDATFRDLGLFIDDMRVLKSIVDDYLQYRPILDKRLSPMKLLAMMTYKNYYPKDFAELPKRRGLLYGVLNNKKEFTQKNIESLENKISIIQKEISVIENHKYESLKELKDLYLLRFIDKHREFKFFEDTTNNTQLALEDCYLDNNFTRLINGLINSYRYDNYSRPRGFQVSFSAISKEIDPDKSYFEKAELWNKKQSNEVHAMRKNINQLEGEKLLIPYRPIKDLFVDEVSGDIKDYIHQHNPDNLDFRLLLFLLQQGLVDESYEDYTSLFHEGVLTLAERDFLINVRLKKDTDINHKLSKCEALLNELSPTDFKESYILNISLLTYICQNITKYTKEFNEILEQIKRSDNKAIFFFDCFIGSSEAVGLFLQHAVTLWDDLWLFVENHFEKKEDRYAFLLIFHLEKTELIKLDKDKHFSSFLENGFPYLGVLETNINNQNLQEIIRMLKLKFERLDRDKISDELMNFIVTNNHYKLSTHNIKEILCFHGRMELSEKLNSAQYTNILISDIWPLIDYVSSNMEKYYDSVLLVNENSNSESEKSLISLINDESVGYDKKLPYLSIQSEWITKINDIVENFWPLAVESKILYPSWGNIINYCRYVKSTCAGDTFPDSFKEYLADKLVYIILREDNAEITEQNNPIVLSLFTEVALNNEYNFEAYSSILYGLRYLKITNIDFSGLSKNKVEFLIDRHFIPFEDYNFDIIRVKYPDLAINLFIANKNDFLGQVSDCTFNASEYKALLGSSSFDTREKIYIIENMTIEELNEDRDLATLICHTILDQGYSIENELLCKLIELCDDTDVKLNMTKTYLFHNEYDENITIYLLNFLDRDYRKISEKNKRPRISTESDMELLNYLKSVGFIKNIITHVGYIKIINREG